DRTIGDPWLGTLCIVVSLPHGSRPRKGRFIMKNLFSITVITAVMLNGAGAAAAELPTFELMGFPITPHQVAVIGSAHVQEQAPTPTLTLGGMPASPHQLTVLTPRSKETAAAPLTNTGSSFH